MLNIFLTIRFLKPEYFSTILPTRNKDILLYFVFWNLVHDFYRIGHFSFFMHNDDFIFGTSSLIDSRYPL